MKRTKIVATIGPASETKTKIEQMVRAGLDVARLNFSHGIYQHHQMLINNIRSVSKKLNTPVAILQDLQGPRIRTGELPADGIKIKPGQEIILAPERTRSSGPLTVVPIQYADLYKDVKKGHLILVEDGTITLQVVSVAGKTIRCKVKAGSVLKSHKGMNFPNSLISIPAITAKDKKDLAFGIKNDVDFVALSFVKDARDILALRRLISALEKKYRHRDVPTKIIAKIERPEAVKHFEEIVAAADGIMIARGDLGLEVPMQDLPLIQKRIIGRCTRLGKPVIVATQMLDSMIRNPLPTRAEVSDVANAILDGTDAIMLSGETATGMYPLAAVRIMSRIANRMTTAEINQFEQLEQVLKQLNDVASSVSFSAQDIAEDINARFIVCVTASGFTARSVVRFRPEIAVVAITPSAKVRRQLSLSWGVYAYVLPFTPSFGQLLERIKRLLVKEKLVKTGDTIVLTASHPLGYQQRTNLLTVETI